jgi:hypothetical protein
MESALRKAGFGKVSTFEKLDLTERFTKAARDIVFVAHA